MFCWSKKAEEFFDTLHFALVVNEHAVEISLFKCYFASPCHSALKIFYGEIGRVHANYFHIDFLYKRFSFSS